MFFQPGDRVRVERFGGRRCDGTVVYDKGGTTVRVRYDSGKVANQERSRVFPVRAHGTFAVGGTRLADAMPGTGAPPSRERLERLLASGSVTTASRLVPSPKPQRAKRSRAYLDFVRGHACQNCGRPGPSEAAHFGPRGVGVKADDRRTNALCGSDHATGHEGCHAAFHRTGSLPQRGFSFGPNDVAQTFYSADETQRLLYRMQVDLLIEWMETKGART